MSHSLPNKFRGLVSASCLTLVFITLAGAADSDRPNPAALAIVRHGLPAVRPVCLRATGPSSADRGVEQVAVELLERHIEQRAGVRLPQLVVESRDLAARLRETSAKLIVLGTAERLKNQACLPQRVKELAGKLGPEGYCISSSARCRSGYPAVVVIGADERGLLYGVGRLLRSMTFLGRDVDLADIEVCTTPALKVRGHLLANHIWSPQYDNWDEAQWDRYLADLALWGVNTILTTPYHPGEWAACRPFDDPPVFTDERVRQTWQFYWRVQQAIPRIARKYGMRFGLWIPPNDVPVDEARPQTIGGRCDNVCPSQPDMRALILKHREAVFKALSPIDLVIVPPSDCGGCSCPACAPWGKTFFALAEEIAAILHRYHPQAWMGISDQNLSRQDDQWLFEHLRTKRPKWLRFVVNGPGSSDLAHMRREIPLDYDVFLYPDTTHLAATAGYLVEDAHTDPLVSRVYQQAHLEATPFARPEALQRAHGKGLGHMQGSFPYSEGSHDDLNKVVWSQLDWDPNANVPALVEEYCRFYYGSECAERLGQVWHSLERALAKRPADNPEIEKTLAAVEDAKREIPPWALHDWRWKMLEVRALLDRFLQLHQRFDPRVEKALKMCLDLGQPELAVRDMAARLRDAGPRPVLDDLRLDLGVMFPYFASAEVARKERKQYGPVPPHPLAAELDSWTPDLREMELLDHRIQALAWELRGQVGLELRAAWIIRGAKTSYDRALERLATIACGPHAAAELKPALQQALHPEQAAAGGTYDDLGHPERQPHLREGRRWEDAFGDNLLGEPLAAERRAVSPSGKDLVMDYKGLSGGVPYELLVTYVQSRNETRRQRLVAVGAGGTFEVHPAMLLPTRPRQYSFTLPAAIAPDGKLTLRFIPVDGRPHNAVASEVRLTPLATR